MQLVLDTTNIVLKTQKRSFYIEAKSGNRRISPNNITSIAITANVLLRADAVRLAIQHQIPILFFDNIGKAKARLWSPYFENLATLRRQQIKFAESNLSTQWIINIFYVKTENQIQNLQWLAQKRPEHRDNLLKAANIIRSISKKLNEFEGQLITDCRNSIMGVEGSMARIYWSAIGKAMPVPFGFEKRSRRPAVDYFNAAINYFYGMTYTVVESALFAAGLDPYLGFLHVDEHKKPVLAFDLIEPFRPWLDRLLMQKCLGEEINEKFFSKNQYGLFLNKHGKAVIIPTFNQFMLTDRQYDGILTTHKNHIFRYAGLLSKAIKNFE